MPMGFLGVYGKVILGVTISGLSLTVVVLVACGYLAFFRSARTHLDRVSFRLLVYALVSHVTFGTMGPVESLYLFPGWQCSLLAFVINFNLLFSASIFFCIGLNLMLVVVYNANGRMMEKYYIIGSLVFCGTCLGSAYASGHLGLDTKNHICWYNNQNVAAMLHWVIGSQMIWMIFLSAAELIMFLVVVLFLLPFTLDSGRPPADPETQTRNSTRLNIVMLRGIILRIVISVYQLQEQAEPGPSQAPVVFGVTVYTARPLIYGMLAATDPSFVRALRARRATPECSSAAQQTTQVSPSVCLTTFVELTVESTHGAESDLLGMDSQTQLGNLSGTQTESTVGRTEMAQSIKHNVGDPAEGVGVAEPIAGPSPAAQWDVARHI